MKRNELMFAIELFLLDNESKYSILPFRKNRIEQIKIKLFNFEDLNESDLFVLKKEMNIDLS